MLAQALRPGQYVLIAEPVTVALGIDEGYEATTGTLDGRVVDAATGESLPGASVYLVDARVGAVADLDGGFAIENLPAGRYTARVTYVGYRTARLALDVFPLSPRLPPVVRLQPEPVASSQAQVEAGDDPAAPGVSALAARGTTVASPAGRGDLAAALAALPGLTRTGASGGRLVVRGADPDALRVFRDGVPVYAPWHAGGLVATLQPEALGRVLLHRGQFPVGLSGGLAAVLETETTSPLAGDSARVVALSPVAARAVADVGLGRGVGLHLTGQRSVLGAVLAPGVRAARGVWAVDPLGGRRGDAVRPEMSFQSGEAGLGVALTRTARLDVQAWGAQDRLDLGDAETRDRSGAVAARARGLVGPRTFATGMLYSTAVDATTRHAGPLAETRETLSETALSVAVEQAVGAHTLSLGTFAAARRVQGRFGRGAAGGVVQDDGRGQQLDAFAADTWSPALGWQLQAGVRAEATRGARAGQDAQTRLRLSPRLFARWTPVRDRLVVRVGPEPADAVGAAPRLDGWPARARRRALGRRRAGRGARLGVAGRRRRRVGADRAPRAGRRRVRAAGARRAAPGRAGLGPVGPPLGRCAAPRPGRGRRGRRPLRGRAVDRLGRRRPRRRRRARRARARGARRRSRGRVSGSVRVERGVGPLGVGVRLGGASGLPGERADVVAGVAVGWVGTPLGVRLDVLALAQARVVGSDRGAAVDAVLPLAQDARALPAWPTLSVTVRW